MKKYLVVFAGWLLVAVLGSFIAKREAVAYPEGYRQWTHTKTHLVGPNNPAWPKYGGFTHIYANEKAVQGYKTDKWPDGAVLVVEVRESTENKGDYALGKRKFIDVMVKDSKKYASTGGWGFEEFMEEGNGKPALNEEGQKKCFSCHQSRAGERLVFTSYKE
jgi:hypothetical protein